MTVIKRFHRTVAVYPGLFFLANVAPTGTELPADLVDGLFETGDICAFGPNGIAFASAFQSHIVTVNVEFIIEPFEARDPTDDPVVRTHNGVFSLTDRGLQFENPDCMQPETRIAVPVSGRRDVVVTRRPLLSPATFTPPLDDPNPTGLEHWTIAFLPGHADV